MSSARFSKSELEHVLSRQGIGIASAFGKRSVGFTPDNSRSINDLESNSRVELEGAKKLQIKCAGKIVVRIKFYRHRLADYSRAISEKSLVDSLCYCGALRGDTEKDILLIDEGQHKVQTKEEERTEVTIEYPEVDYHNLFEESQRTDGR